MSGRRRLVVIGNGMAGARLVEEVIAKGGRTLFEIAVFGDEPCGNYNRILLSGVLAGTHHLHDIVMNPPSWYEANGVRLHAGIRAERIDRETRTVHGGPDIVEPFDALVFATGSRPHLPPIDGLVDDAGALEEGAFVFRTVDDCERMLARTRDARAVVVIGGGLLGLEAARGFLNHGLEVTVVQRSERLMDAQLDDLASRVLRRQFERMGLNVMTGHSTVGVIKDDRLRGVRFSDGSTVPCDMLVVAAGIRPNVQLAEASGLDVRRGIVVGDDLACPGAESIYAIGECAEHRGTTYGLVAPLWEQAAVLSDRLTARRADAFYAGSVLTTKLKVAGLDVAVMGEKEPIDESDEVISYSEPSRGIYKKVIVRGDRLVGAILIGDGPLVPSIAHTFASAGALPPRRADLLFPSLVDAPRRSVEELPDDAQICDCNGVSKGQIVECVLRGASSAQVVCQQTRAGTGCGSCRSEVQRILELVWTNLDANPANDATAFDDSATSSTIAAGAGGGERRSDDVNAEMNQAWAGTLEPEAAYVTGRGRSRAPSDARRS